jgi:ribosomal protein L40E
VINPIDALFDHLGEGSICDRCGATLMTMADACATKGSMCPGLHRLKEAMLAIKEKLGKGIC